MMKRLILFLWIIILFTGCGTLGSFRLRKFWVSKEKFESALDSLSEKYPEYAIPDKWKKHDHWMQNGYGFLKFKIYYFSSNPEEMYFSDYVQNIDNSSDTNNIVISVRAVYNNKGLWYYNDDCNSKERKRIEYRFDTAIIQKLEHFTKTKAKREEDSFF